MCCLEKRPTESPYQHSAPGADRMPMRGWGLASGIFRLRVWPLRLCGTHVAGSVAGDSLGAGPLFATDSPRLRKPCGALWSGGLFFLLQFMLSRFELPSFCSSRVLFVFCSFLFHIGFLFFSSTSGILVFSTRGLCGANRQYNGMAPAAKIVFTDLSDSSQALSLPRDPPKTTTTGNNTNHFFFLCVYKIFITPCTLINHDSRNPKKSQRSPKKATQLQFPPAPIAANATLWPRMATCLGDRMHPSAWFLRPPPDFDQFFRPPLLLGAGVSSAPAAPQR